MMPSVIKKVFRKNSERAERTADYYMNPVGIRKILALFRADVKNENRRETLNGIFAKLANGISILTKIAFPPLILDIPVLLSADITLTISCVCTFIASHLSSPILVITLSLIGIFPIAMLVINVMAIFLVGSAYALSYLPFRKKVSSYFAITLKKDSPEIEISYCDLDIPRLDAVDNDMNAISHALRTNGYSQFPGVSTNRYGYHDHSYDQDCLPAALLYILGHVLYGARKQLRRRHSTTLVENISHELTIVANEYIRIRSEHPKYSERQVTESILDSMKALESSDASITDVITTRRRLNDLIASSNRNEDGITYEMDANQPVPVNLAY